METHWYSIIYCLCCSSACCCLLLFSFGTSGFPVSIPPLFPVPSLSPSLLSSSTFPFASSLEARRRRVVFVEAGKAALWRFLLFSMKLAAGVAYLTWTEIPVVGRQGVPLITSAATISFRLIERMSRILFLCAHTFSPPPFLLLLSVKWTLVSYGHINHRGRLVTLAWR